MHGRKIAEMVSCGIAQYMGGSLRYFADFAGIRRIDGLTEGIRIYPRNRGTRTSRIHLCRGIMPPAFYAAAPPLYFLPYNIDLCKRHRAIALPTVFFIPPSRIRREITSFIVRRKRYTDIQRLAKLIECLHYHFKMTRTDVFG